MDALKVHIVHSINYLLGIVCSFNLGIFLLDIKGRTGDTCSSMSSPCLHNGVCIQVTQAPGYRCRCDGTGFWGSRCQRKCPGKEETYLLTRFPYECVVI